MGNKLNVSLDSAQSAVRVAVANALAQALVLGIEQCDEEGATLSQRQQVELAAMAIMSYDTAIETCAGLDFEATLFNRLAKGGKS
jgi:hypothetical protein